MYFKKLNDKIFFRYLHSKIFKDIKSGYTIIDIKNEFHKYNTIAKYLFNTISNFSIKELTVNSLSLENLNIGYKKETLNFPYIYEPKLIYDYNSILNNEDEEDQINKKKYVLKYKDGIDCFIINKKYKIGNKIKWYIYDNTYNKKIISSAYNITDIIYLLNIDIYFSIENIFQNNPNLVCIKCILRFKNNKKYIVDKREVLLYNILNLKNIKFIIYPYAFITEPEYKLYFINNDENINFNIKYNENILKLKETEMDINNKFIYISINNKKKIYYNISIYLPHLSVSKLNDINIKNGNLFFYDILLNFENILNKNIKLNSLIFFKYNNLDGCKNEKILYFIYKNKLFILTNDQKINYLSEKKIIQNISKQYPVIDYKISFIQNKGLLFFISNTKIDIDWENYFKKLNIDIKYLNNNNNFIQDLKYISKLILDSTEDYEKNKILRYFSNISISKIANDFDIQITNDILNYLNYNIEKNIIEINNDKYKEIEIIFNIILQLKFFSYIR